MYTISDRDMEQAIRFIQMTADRITGNSPTERNTQRLARLLGRKLSESMKRQQRDRQTGRASS